MQFESAEISLLGDREDNQDRVAIIRSADSALLIVLDGMGGHSDGSLAADTALRTVNEAFAKQAHPLLDPLGFMHLALSRAHDEVVRVGAAQSIDARPRATVALCVVQDGQAYWAHVGDSRIYLLRGHQILERTRDHSHVELLLREGKITSADVANHPMRNFVECCLGGDAAVPEMTVSGSRPIQVGDVLLLCTDGIWSNLQDEDIASFSQQGELGPALEALARRAVKAGAPYSDNSTAAVLKITAR